MDLTLVLLHGYPFDNTMWRALQRELPPTVFCPDLRWVAAPNKLPPAPALEVLADDVAAAMLQRGSARAVVAGFSMGGYVALALAQSHPRLVSGLALISSQTAADSEEVRTNRRAMIGRIQREGALAAAEAVIPKLFAKPDEEHAALARRAAERAGTAGLSWALEAMARRPDRTHVLTSLDAPLLIVHGAEDQLVPVERARHLAAAHSPTVYRELSGVGHATPLEAPVLVSAALRSFLQLQTI